jgi:hypothetical protein
MVSKASYGQPNEPHQWTLFARAADWEGARQAPMYQKEERNYGATIAGVFKAP